MQDKAKYLNSFDAFQDLSTHEIETVRSQTRLVNYSAGHLFYMPDDPGEVLFILKVGRVQLYRMSTDGRKFVVAVLHPGAIFGHMALLGQGLHSTYAEALDDVVICVWNRTEVEDLLGKNPRLALRFLEAVGHRLAHAEQRLAEITFKRMPARLANLLLQLDREESGSGCLEGYTHQYLAEMLGTYRETVTQILNEFKAANWINLGRKRIEILDRAGLEELWQAG